MELTIIGHNVEIIDLNNEGFSNEDNFIYEINDEIIDGNDSGTVAINVLSYDWKIIQNIDLDEYENICYENKRMGDFLEKLGLTPDDITSFIVNGSDEDFVKMIEKIKS